jgi:catechol 2,3-dioxygenase-like lactoylglutathione lyase family enzyme
MTQTRRFEGVSLPVSDVARSVAFYRDMVGLTVEQSRPAFALLRLGEVTLGLLRTRLDDASRDMRGSIHVEFTTDDLDALYAEMQARGVSFHEPPHDAPWERAMATYDPDGYKVEFAQGRRGHNQPG